MKKALMVWGGWDGHEPKQCVELFEPHLRANGFDVTVSDKTDVYADQALMSKLSLIVQCVTCGQIKPEEEKGLLDTVKSGVGFAGWHGGLCDSFRSNTEYQFMTGGQWV